MDKTRTFQTNEPLHLLWIDDLASETKRIVPEANSPSRFRCCFANPGDFFPVENQLMATDFDLVLVNLDPSYLKNSCWFEDLQKAFPGIPIIILYEPEHEKSAQKLVEKGAYLQFPKLLSNRDLLGTLIESVGYRCRLERQNRSYQKRINDLESKLDKSNNQAGEKRIDSESRLSIFLASLAHDLKSPLHGILSFSSFGISKIEHLNREKLVDYLTKIKNCGNRILNLVNDLVDLSKLESGLVEYEFRLSSLSEIIAIAINENAAIKTAKNITVEFNPPAFNDGIEIDPLQIMQVLKNLLSNAIKFSSPGETVTIEVKDLGEFLQICIKDRGMGIGTIDPAEFFNKYTHSNKPRQGDDSTGLGLAICKHIVIDHHGAIWVEKNTDVGIKILIQIPKQSVSLTRESELH